MRKAFFLFLCAMLSFFCSGCGLLEFSSGNRFWLYENPVTAHALGGVADRDGNLYTYTNSYEAFVKNYEAGIRCFECDIDYTLDDVPVLCHDWGTFRNMSGDSGNGGGSMTYLSFSSSILRGDFHPLSLAGMIDLMEEYQDIYIDIDFGGKDPCIAVERISERIGENRNLKGRFIIEIYSFDDYKKIDGLYHFDNYLFTESLYNGGAALADSQRSEIIAFCAEENIRVAAVFSEFLTGEIIETYKRQGIFVVAYGGSANSAESFGKLKEIGCAGIQSDFVTPGDWNNYGK